MKHKRIAALIGMMLLFIAVSSTALAVNTMWCNNCSKFVEFTSLGFRKIDETAHAVVVKCNECGTEKWASTGPHVGGTATCAQKAVCRGCGAEYGEKLSYHKNTVLYSHKVPTCTESGWDSYFGCLECGYSAKKEIGPLGHDYGSWTSNGDGTHTHTCSRDGSHTETVSCSGGTASCSAKAVCAECGAEYGETDPENHALTHHEAKAATCTEIGWDAYDTCSNCDYTTYAEIPASGHALTHHEAKAATCTEMGWSAYDACSNCDYTTAHTETPASGHALTHHEAKAATCTEIGWDAYDTCSNCDYTTYVEIPASGHALTHHEAKAATCTEMGWSAYDACSNCGYTTAHTETPASGHALTHHEAKAATCTEIGWNAYDTCSNCDYTTYAEIPASGHVLTNYGENWNLVFCPVCGKVENGERLELLETASAAAVDGKLPEGKLIARMDQRYLSLAFVYEGKLTAPAGRVKITLPAEIVQGKRLLLIAPDGTETELPFEIVGEMISFTLDFTEVEIPAVLVLKPL